MRTKFNRENWLERVEGPSDINTESNEWTSICKVKVPSKINVFLWRLARHSIPAGEVLHRRNMSTTASCPLCGAHDTWKHALLDCPMSRSTWVLSSDDVIDQLSGVQYEGARHWIFAMKEKLKQDEFVRLAVTLWAIWGARRKAIHEGIFQSPFTIHSLISSYLREIEMLNQPSLNPERAAVTRPQRWLPPQESLFKINVDAAVGLRGEHGSMGTVCRDQTECFVGASAFGFTNIGDPPTLEALAIREALDLADELNLHHIQVATDCKEVVEEIKKGGATRYGAIVQEIKLHAVSFIRSEERRVGKECRN